MDHNNMFGDHANANMRGYGHGPPQAQAPPQNENPRARPSVSTLYVALDGYENEARQRKYMIAECEDTIENLKTALAQSVEANKQLESEVEKLDMEAMACEVNYEKNLKQKELIENDYDNLSKEMDQVSEVISKQRILLQQFEELRNEKLEMIKKTEERYLAEYMKNPKFAEIMETKKLTAELEDQIQERSQELQGISDELRIINSHFSAEWPTFVNKCVTLAETHAEIRKNSKTRNQLKNTLQNAMKATGFSSFRVKLALNNILPLRPTNQDCYQPTRFVSKTATPVSFPKPKRSSTFQHMEEILSHSTSVRESGANRSSFTSRSSDNNVRQYIPMSTPLRSAGSSLVEQLKSRLKGTVLVNPMPRNTDTSNVPMPLQQQSLVVGAVVPSRNEDNDHCSLSQQSQALAYFPPATTEATAPSLMVPRDNNSKSQNMDVNESNENGKAPNDNRIGQRGDFGIVNQPNHDNNRVGFPPTMSFPHTQGVPGSPLKRISNPQPSFQQPSSPAVSEFNFFGGGCNMGHQSPAATGGASGGGFDFFGGLFNSTPSASTEQASTNNDFFSFF
ncbi:unnamed protein product [Orchesella dallaii]|uniref:Uncharacterized protein n=1 Tax=Orchesella dallaii TaxID=48710 RepID=A0ABP1R2E7_9HEXA